MADYPDEPPFVRKQILYGMLHTFLLKDGVQVGNVSLVMEIDAHQPLVILYPQEGITAQIDMVEALVLFQRIYIFGVGCREVKLAPSYRLTFWVVVNTILPSGSWRI